MCLWYHDNTIVYILKYFAEGLDLEEMYQFIYIAAQKFPF